MGPAFGKVGSAFCFYRWAKREGHFGGWGEPKCTLVLWRQGFRHLTRNECMGWFDWNLVWASRDDWAEAACTFVLWREGFRHPTRDECMGWFAQIPFGSHAMAGARQPVHSFCRGKGVGIQQGMSVWVVRPNPLWVSRDGWGETTRTLL